MRRTDKHSWRYRMWRQLSMSRKNDELTLFNRIVIGAIVVMLVVVSLQTETSFSLQTQNILRVLEFGLWVFFTIEWLLRLWASACNPKFINKKNPYLAWLAIPINFLDTLTIIVGLVVLFFYADSGGGWLRFFRIILVLRYLGFARENKTIYFLSTLFRRHASALFSSLSILGVVTYIMAFMLWIAEKDDNPALASIPKAFWWATVTITTTGYGDVVPITFVGKTIGVIFMFVSMSLIALPGAIMAAGFMQLLQEEKQRKIQAKQAVPPLEEEGSNKCAKTFG